jgi:hypothetical protein
VPEQSALRQPPPLPSRLTDLRPLLLIGIGLWFVVFVVLAVARFGFHAGPTTVWVWTCLSGWVLGLIGLFIVHWQRGAARRGSRSAQRSALD